MHMAGLPIQPSAWPRCWGGLRRFVLAWLTGAAIFSGAECSLLLVQAHDDFSSFGQRLVALPLGLGNLLPYSLAALGGLSLVGAVSSWLARRTRWARSASAAVVGLLSLPYALPLARFTFSGEKARELPHHGLLVLAAAVGVSTGFAVLAWLFCLRRDWRRLPGAACAVWAAAAAACLVLSRAMLPSEYEPLHEFLGIVGLVFAALAGSEIAHWLPEPRRPRQSAAVLLGVALAWTLTSGVVLARYNDLAWLLWGRTAATRYLVQRWTFLEDGGPSRLEASGPMVLKPNLDTPRSVKARASRAQARPPHIILFGIDGVQPDHLGAYGYTRRRTSPAFDRLAQEGALFRRAYSSYPATRNFSTSLLLGRYIPEFVAHKPPRAYQQVAITRLLKQRGYHVLVDSWFEFSTAREFDPKVYQIDNYLEPPTRQQRLQATQMPYVPEEERFAGMAKHLDEAKARDLPVFLWTHLLGTHPAKKGFTPVAAHPFGPTRTDQYDSAIAGADDWLQRLREMMADRFGDSRPVLWFVFSDHGMYVDEGDGKTLYDRIVRVPLVVAGPGIAHREVGEPVDVSLDLAATVLDLAGIQPPADYDGVSLAPVLMDGSGTEELASRVIVLSRAPKWSGGVFGRYKYLKYRDSESLFDSARDPEQRHSISEAHPALLRKLSTTVAQELRRRSRAYRGGQRDDQRAAPRSTHDTATPEPGSAEE
jgi:arylsulfatase A-like enzyme